MGTINEKDGVSNVVFLAVASSSMFPFEVFRSGAAAANLLQRPSHEFTPLIPEPVVFPKLIGTLRNNRGIFVHETMLSLLVAGRQQGCKPTKSSNELLETTKRFHEIKPYRLLRHWGKQVLC